MAHHHFCHVLLVTEPAIMMLEGRGKSVNSRRQGLSEAPLEGGYQSRAVRIAKTSLSENHVGRSGNNETDSVELTQFKTSSTHFIMKNYL